MQKGMGGVAMQREHLSHTSKIFDMSTKGRQKTRKKNLAGCKKKGTAMGLVFGYFKVNVKCFFHVGLIGLA
jgi:hypothetical protein